MSRSFDGVDDTISFGNPFNMGTSDWSVLCWFNPVSVATSKTLVRKGDGFSPTPTWLLRTVGANLHGLIFLDGSNSIGITGSTTISTAGIWYHAAITFDRDGNMSLYLNGNSDATPVSIASGSAWNITTTDFGGIGCYFDGTPNTAFEFFNGKIAHAQIFRRVLSLSEIKQLMNFPGSISGPNLLAYWPLWGGSIEGDYSGNNKGGTVTGATVSQDNPPINGIFTVPKPELIHAF